MEKLCCHTEDILQLSSKEYRHTVLYFYQCLVQGQYLQLKQMRLYFFLQIRTHEHIDDTIPKYFKLYSNANFISVYVNLVSSISNLSLNNFQIRVISKAD